MPSSALIAAASRRAIASVTSFSRVPPRPMRARVLAAVAGVDRDHEVAPLAAAGDDFTGLATTARVSRARQADVRRQLPGRRSPRRPASRACAPGRGAGGISTTSRWPALPSGPDHETLHRLRDVEVEHDAQLAVGLRPGAHAAHRALPVRQRPCACARRALSQVDDDAVGILEREHLVARRRAQVEHQAGTLRSGPEPHVVDARGGRRGRGQRRAARQQRCTAGSSGELGRAATCAVIYPDAEAIIQ